MARTAAHAEDARVDARVAAALGAWRAALGDDHVIDDAAACARAATATFAAPARVLAILRPADRAEVQACLRIAHAHGVPVHAISGGRNWGYGSAAPARDAVVMELARLDRILDFDERLAYVTLEPGVTFRQLAAFLRTCRARVFASVTGGPADGSVIGNALERGDGAGPLGDRFGHVCGLEIVLATGECVHTGFARIPGAHVAPLARWGVGPALDGLFSQAGLGVVTRMTVWLTPYPAHFQLAAFATDDDARLPALIEALRELRLGGVTPATTPVWNDYKALPLVAQYPWEDAGGRTPLPAAARAALRARHGLGRWNGTVSLYAGSAAHGAALRDLVQATLGPALGGGGGALAFREGPASPLDATPEACGPALGIPHDHNLASLYWRMRRPPGVDPHADGCGFLWLGHAVPFTGDHARTASDVLERGLAAAGFEPAIALLGVTERALSVLGAIAYDRTIPGEDARARACHAAVGAELRARGYPPFRAGILDGPALAGDPGTEAVLARLRAALDPADVLVHPARPPRAE